MKFATLSVILTLAVVGPAMARAQFQAPTDEELKMTSDPKAPGAAAVYLDYEEIANDQEHYFSFYERIKVLTEKGKDLATVEIPFPKGNFSITDISGRTIHPDGTVIPLEVKPEDLLVLKIGDRQVDKKVFTLPSVEVGSILEYRYRYTPDVGLFSSPFWDVQKPYFVHKAHYEFTPFKIFLPGPQNVTSSYLTDQNGRVLNNLIWWQNLPPGVKLEHSGLTGRFSVDVTDVPPIPEEQWMPPIESLLYKVEFYYSYATEAKDFWVQVAKSWSQNADHFAEPTKAIRDAVAGLVGPGDSDLDKAKKLYAAVQGLENTDYTRTKSESERKELKLKEAKRAEDVWAQKGGSSGDIALLYLAMLRAAGLTANPAQVVNRESRLFEQDYLNIHQLDDTLVILTTGDKQIALDPGEKMCPFGTLSWKHSGVQGISKGPGGVGWMTTPTAAYTANSTLRTGVVNVDEHGAVSGTLTFTMTGQEALRWRQIALENDPDEVRKRFDRELEGMMPDGLEAHVDHFLEMDQPDVNLMAMITVKGSMGTATARRLLLPGLFFETRGSTPFVNQEKREVPVDMHYAAQVTEQITYQLPSNLAVEGAPPDASFSWAGHAQYILQSKSEPGKIVITRVLGRAFDSATPEEYQDLRGFYSKVAAADRAELVLTAASAAKGN